MHVNHKRKALFFHVPKTGGTAIHTAFSHYKITNKDISQYLRLPPVKLHCSMLAEDAIKSAINDYQNKNTL